jgi:hypothetical protein
MNLMLYRPAHPPFPRKRMSPTAMATAGAIHVALLWLLLQHSPLERTIRYVVYQYVKPISPIAQSGANRAITIRPPAATSQTESPPVFSNTPESSVPLKTTTQLPDAVQAKKPVPGPRRSNAAPPLEPRPPRPARAPAAAARHRLEPRRAALRPHAAPPPRCRPHRCWCRRSRRIPDRFACNVRAA